MKGAAAMMEPAEDTIVRNLMEALNRLHDDLDRVELWTAALSDFQKPVPDYTSENKYLLPHRKARAGRF
jgi:hypothetical protein